jgi:hypothetical protein
MKRKNIKTALMFIFLVISIPFCISLSLAQLNDTNQTTVNQTTPTQNDDCIYYDDPACYDDFNMSDPGDVSQECIAKHQKSSKLANVMDNGIIQVLEKISAIMYMIYTTMTAVHTILSTVSTFFSLEGGCCAGLPYTSSACGAFDKAKNAWDYVYNSPIVSTLGCFVSCGWCTGKGCGGFFAKLPLFNQVPKVMGVGRLSPFENIYTATACLCPTAILFNLRKLKAIYQSYDCCIQESCTNGISTESCERMLDEATCMYWKGSLYKILARIAMGLIVGVVQQMIMKIVGKNAMLNCIISIFDLAQIPGTIQGVQEGFKWVSVSFSQPNCKDLGFDKIIKDVQASKPLYKDVKVYDSNRDGRYDGITSVVSGRDGLVHSSRTSTQEIAINNNHALLSSRGMIQPVTDVTQIKRGDVVTLKAGSDPRILSDTSFVVSDTQSGNRFSVPVTADDGHKYELSDNQISSGNLKVERLSSQATGEDRRLWSTYGVAIHRYNDYMSQDRVHSSSDTEIGESLGRGESAIVQQRDGSYLKYTKDYSGNVKPQKVGVIKDYKTYTDYKTMIDGKQVRVTEIMVTTDKSEYTRINGQLYKWNGNEKSGEWKPTEEPMPIVVQGTTSEATIVAIKEQENSQKRQERAYQAAWLLLDSTLGQYAYNKIDQMCIDEWKSSQS